MNDLCMVASKCGVIYVLIHIKYKNTAERKKVFVGIDSVDNQCCHTHTNTLHSQAVVLTSVVSEAGGVEFAHVKLHPDDGKHDNGEEEQQANLKQRNHRFHYGLQHHLET